MAWNNWTPIDSTTYMSIDFVRMARENQQVVNDLIESYMAFYPELFAVDVSQDMEQQPFPDYLNLIERNLDKLLSCSPSWFPHQDPTRTWLGEWYDIEKFDYDDVNRWFRDLLTIKVELDTIPVRYRISGTFSSGTNGETQRIRRA